MAETDRLLEFSILCHWSDELVTSSSHLGKIAAGSKLGHHDIINDGIGSYAGSWDMRHFLPVVVLF